MHDRIEQRSVGISESRMPQFSANTGIGTASATPEPPSGILLCLGAAATALLVARFASAP